MGLFNSEVGNLRVKNDIQNLDELKNIYKSLDMIITSRYHSLVLAIKHGVYPLVIGWNQNTMIYLINLT